MRIVFPSAHPVLTGSAGILGAMLVAAGLAAWRHQPPAPLPADAPPEAFSAQRAFPLLAELVGDGIPHPNGSRQNDIVRERILKAFRERGYEPEVQEAVVDRRGRPFTVRNVAARLEGSGATTAAGPGGKPGGSGSPRSAVLLMSHYDSVPEGPGASDAGVSVAIILELARLLRAAPQARNPIVFLITDGEEYGLLGARAFVDGHPSAQEIGAVVNLEARGTSGLSLMFETGKGTAWLAARMAGRLHHPGTSSLMASIYRTMPNTTDLSVFLRAGYTGYNFAFIGGRERYHTPDDDLAHVDPRSLQHQGENALAVTQSLAASDLSALAGAGEAVWFDFLGSLLVWWPMPLTLPLGLLASALFVWLLFRLRRRGILSFGRALAGLGLSLLLSGIAFGTSWLFGALARNLGWIVGRNAAVPAAVVSGFWLAALLGILAGVLILSRRVRRPILEELAWGSGALWALLALAAALLFPPGSYLFLAPALIAGAAGLAMTWIPSGIAGAGMRFRWDVLVTLFLAACLWLPMEILICEALGLAPTWLVAARPALVCVLASPLLLPLRRTSSP